MGPTCFFLSELESSTCDGKGLLGFLCTGFVIFVSIIVCRFCFQRYSSAKLEKAVCQAATINQFQGIDSFVQETYEHKKRPVVLGCTLRYQTFQLPNLSW